MCVFRDDFDLRVLNVVGHFPQNVKLWYGQRARSRHGPMYWTINWTGRQVFYRENAALVLETQKTLYRLATGVKTSEESDEPLDLHLVEEEEVFEDPTKPVELFHFFQRAVTAEWNALSTQERKAYEAKALVWRERGPRREERQLCVPPSCLRPAILTSIQCSLAEKEAGRVLHQFSDNVYRQMGVRLYYLVSYEDTSGEHVAC